MSSCQATFDCDDPNFAFKFIGFDSIALADVRLYKYDIGDNFVHIIDSTQVGINIPRGNWDTGYILRTERYNIKGSVIISPHFEWKICVIATGNCYTLNNMNFQARRKKGFKESRQYCVNNGSFKFNDTVYTILGDDVPYGGKELHLYK